MFPSNKNVPKLVPVVPAGFRDSEDNNHTKDFPLCEKWTAESKKICVYFDLYSWVVMQWHQWYHPNTFRDSVVTRIQDLFD